MRLFIGIVFDDYVIRKIEKTQYALKEAGVRGKFVGPENTHLCVSFLGEVEETEIPSMSERLSRICDKHEEFTIDLEGILTIPNKRKPRVLAMGVSDPGNKLKGITNDIVGEIGGDSKPPHVTLCRLNPIEDSNDIAKAIKDIDVKIGGINVNAIKLIKSVLNPTGPGYTMLGNFRLNSCEEFD